MSLPCAQPCYWQTPVPKHGGTFLLRSEAKDYPLGSDFDQTLSFNNSGIVLSELMGIEGFGERIAGLANIHLVQQGGELAYLLLHDPENTRTPPSRGISATIQSPAAIA